MGREDSDSASGVTLAVTSDAMPPEDITSVLSVQPTRSGRRGDLMASGMPKKRHSWHLDVPNQGSRADDLEWLATFVSDHADGFRELSHSGTEMAALVYLSIDPDDRAVGLNLDPWVLGAFGAAGVGLEIVVLPN